jgi:hypothetical protein
MKHLIIIVFFLQIGVSLHSQVFSLEFFDAERQGQVDSFIINYPQVKKINQKLTIRKNVTNLNGLKNISEIENFEIKDKSILQNFSGLENLKKCGSLELIKSQNKIVNFVGLDNLEELGMMGIGKSDALQSFTGLENLKRIGDGIIIHDCPRLKSIEALNNVDTISFDFFDTGSGHMGIFEKYSIISFRNCDSLESLKGLENVASFTYLVLRDNDMLNDISAISNSTFLKYPTRQSLYITGNKNLSICNYPNICDYIQTVPRQVVLQLGQDKIYNIDIFNNAASCKDYQTLLNTCLVPTEEQLVLNTAEIYPNPGSNIIEVNLESDLPIDIDVFDSQGRNVASVTSTHYIETEHLPNGFYFVRIKHKGSNASTTKKWVKI